MPCPGFIRARHNSKNGDTREHNWTPKGQKTCLPFALPHLFFQIHLIVELTILLLGTSASSSVKWGFYLIGHLRGLSELVYTKHFKV